MKKIAKQSAQTYFGIFTEPAITGLKLFNNLLLPDILDNKMTEEGEEFSNVSY